MSSLGLSWLKMAIAADTRGKLIREAVETLARSCGFDSGMFEAGTYPSYQSLAMTLDAQSASLLLRTVCVVDLSAAPVQSWFTLSDVHPLRPTWLAWRFPEVYWIFLIGENDARLLGLEPEVRHFHFVDHSELDKLGELLHRHAHGLRAWFDPARLRQSALPGDSVPVSSRRGLVFDEELGFASFNGYLLHRLGLPTRMIASANEFKHCRHLGAGPFSYSILEDLELCFADSAEEIPDGLLVPRDPGDEAAVIADRLAFWQIPPARIQARIFISSSLVADQPSVVKPFGGLYEREILLRVEPTADVSFPAMPAGAHSAPGTHQAVAAELLARARDLEPQASTLGAVHGALLALCAERLLGHQTYAMALESVTLRHGFEVRAECGFTGAAEELDISQRIADIRASVNQLVFKRRTLRGIVADLLPGRGPPGAWRKLYKRIVQATNARLEALEKLRTILDEHKKLEEEESVLQRIRRLRVRSFALRRIVFDRITPARSRYRRSFALGCFRSCIHAVELAVRVAVSIPMLYVTVVLNPFLLIATVLAWIAGFGLVFQRWAAGFAVDLHYSFADWLRHSAVTFLAMQQGLFGDPKMKDYAALSSAAFSSFWSLTVTEMAVGYFHMALLITVLVHRFTRR